jgi:hypothetical protein
MSEYASAKENYHIQYRLNTLGHSVLGHAADPRWLIANHLTTD